jgi:hypothetical protein
VCQQRFAGCRLDQIPHTLRELENNLIRGFSYNLSKTLDYYEPDLGQPICIMKCWRTIPPQVGLRYAKTALKLRFEAAMRMRSVLPITLESSRQGLSAPTCSSPGKVVPESRVMRHRRLQMVQCRSLWMAVGRQHAPEHAGSCC